MSPSSRGSASPHSIVSGRNVHSLAHAVLGAFLIVTQVVPLPVIVQMLTSTGCILHIASHASLAMLEKDPLTGQPPEVESLSSRDAMMFPIIGSSALFTMYVAYKLLSKVWVNFLLTTYLTLVGLVALAETLRPIVEPLFPEKLRRRELEPVRLVCVSSGSPW